MCVCVGCCVWARAPKMCTLNDSQSLAWSTTTSYKRVALFNFSSSNGCSLVRAALGAEWAIRLGLWTRGHLCPCCSGSSEGGAVGRVCTVVLLQRLLKAVLSKEGHEEEKHRPQIERSILKGQRISEATQRQGSWASFEWTGSEGAVECDERNLAAVMGRLLV